MEILSSSWRSGSAGRRLPTFANAPYATTYLCAGEQCLLLETSRLLAACPPGDQPTTYLCAGEQCLLLETSRLLAACPPGDQPITYLYAGEQVGWWRLLPATRLLAARPPGDHVGTGDQAQPLVTAIVIVTML
jgi:hypothetical protein